MGAEVVFVRVSFGFPEPEVGPAGVMPATEALVQLNEVPVVALVGV